MVKQLNLLEHELGEKMMKIGVIHLQSPRPWFNIYLICLGKVRLQE